MSSITTSNDVAQSTHYLLSVIRRSVKGPVPVAPVDVRLCFSFAIRRMIPVPGQVSAKIDPVLIVVSKNDDSMKPLIILKALETGLETRDDILNLSELD